MDLVINKTLFSIIPNPLIKIIILYSKDRFTNSILLCNNYDNIIFNGEDLIRYENYKLYFMSNFNITYHLVIFKNDHYSKNIKCATTNNIEHLILFQCSNYTMYNLVSIDKKTNKIKYNKKISLSHSENYTMRYINDTICFITKSYINLYDGEKITKSIPLLMKISSTFKDNITKSCNLLLTPDNVIYIYDYKLQRAYNLRLLLCSKETKNIKVSVFNNKIYNYNVKNNTIQIINVLNKSEDELYQINFYSNETSKLIGVNENTLFIIVDGHYYSLTD